MKDYFYLAGNIGGQTIVTIFTIAVVLLFIAFLVVFLVLDYKNTKVSELRKKLYNSTEKHEKYEVNTVYSDKSKNYSGTEILPIPTKEPSEEYNYEFVGWDKNYFNESGDTIAKPIYLKRLNKFVVNFYLDDKTTLLKTVEVEYGKSADATDLMPEKPETDEFSFEFDGWSKDISSVKEDESVYAVFKATPKKCNYKFVDSDGTVLFEETAVYGTPIVYNVTPVSKDKSMVFSHFENYTQGQKLEENEIFTAVYKPISDESNADNGNVEIKTENSLASDTNQVAENLETPAQDAFSENDKEMKDENQKEDDLSDKTIETLDENSQNLNDDVENSQIEQFSQNENLQKPVFENEKDSYFRKNYNSNFTFFDTDSLNNDEVVEEFGAGKPDYLARLDANNEKSQQKSNSQSKNVEDRHETGKEKLFNMNFAHGSSQKNSFESNSAGYVASFSNASANLNVDGHSKQDNVQRQENKSKTQVNRFGGGLVSSISFNEVSGAGQVKENSKTPPNNESLKATESRPNTVKKVKDGVTIEINTNVLKDQKQEPVETAKTGLSGFEKLRNNNNSQKVVRSNSLINHGSEKTQNVEKEHLTSAQNRNFNNGTRLNNFSSLYSDDENLTNKATGANSVSSSNKIQKRKGTFAIFTGEELGQEKEKPEVQANFGANATMRKNYFTDTKIGTNSFKKDNYETKTHGVENPNNYFEAVNHTNDKKITEKNSNTHDALQKFQNNVENQGENENLKESDDNGSPLPRISVSGAKKRTEQARQASLSSNQNLDIPKEKSDEDLLFGTILINHRKKK